jgi:hypothetical protein
MNEEGIEGWTTTEGEKRRKEGPSENGDTRYPTARRYSATKMEARFNANHTGEDNLRKFEHSCRYVVTDDGFGEPDENAVPFRFPFSATRQERQQHQQHRREGRHRDDKDSKNSGESPQIMKALCNVINIKGNECKFCEALFFQKEWI